MRRPWLSVVMPTYNGAAFLAAALESIAAQKEDDIEVLAVDDGSTDETLALLEHTPGCYLCVSWRGRVGNWVANTNYGLSLARGEYVCYLHQDDCWLPGRACRAEGEGAAIYPSVVLFLHASVFIDARGRFLGAWHVLCRTPIGRCLPTW